jgi:hypothetical protein
MKTFLVFTIFYLLSFTISAQMLGVVLSSEDSASIEGVHLINTSQNIMAISDERGHFELSAMRGDTVIVSNINFNTKQFVVKDADYLKFYLNPATIELEEVRVSNLPETASDFRKKLLEMDGTENTIEVAGLNPRKAVGAIPKNYDPNYTKSLGYAINKPISFLVKKISKNHKNKVKYYQTIANQQNSIANSEKYNPKLVTELTGLEGDALTDFMDFMSLSPSFIEKSTDYEIAVHILKEYDEFKSKNG